MSVGGKIRFLLLVLGICCIATALSLNNSITQNDLLLHEAQNLQQNLAAKETTIRSFLTDNQKLKEFKTFRNNGNLALNFIDKYRNNGINLLIYKNNELQFWSSIKTFPQNINRLKEGSSFQPLANGLYEVIKKTDNQYTFIFLITVKTQFSIENQYLKNRIAPELFANNSLDLAAFTDKNAKEIFNLNKDYLFAVKLSDEFSKNIYATVQVWLWVIGLFCICLFVNSYATYLARKGFVVAGTAILIIFFLAFRLSDLQYFWFNHQFTLEIFSPSIYAQSEFLPSLGDLLLHVISITWISLFIYVHRFEYTFSNWVKKNKIVAIAFHIAFLLILALIALIIDDVFFGLIYNSKINFDITNIINLGFISWLSILILCLSWFAFYLIINVFLELSKQLNLSHKHRLLIFLSLVSVCFVYKLIGDFTVFFLVYALLIFVIAYNNYIQKRQFSIGVFAILFLCIAFLTSIKYTKFIDLKERSTRRDIALKLENSDDPKVINAINTLELGITRDSLVVDYFKNPNSLQTASFHNYINKKYLDGYLSRFEYKLYEYNAADVSLKSENNIVPITKYKNLVKSGAIKTAETSFSYRINDTFGYQNYFGLIPVFDAENYLGTLIIELTSQSYDYNSRFPELLIDGKLKSDEDFSEYSLAFYKNNKLYSQSGKFTYPMTNTNEYKGALNDVVFQNEESNNISYSHAIRKYDNSKIIVISKEKMPYVVRLATLSFFFLVFILFGISIYIILWTAKNLEDSKAGWFNINRYLMINANKILYKTRIQLSVVLSVVATLLIVGFTTFSYIKNEYQKQQKESIREKIRKVQLSYQKQILNSGLRSDDKAGYEFNQFADVNAAYLNLYDINGKLLLTSLPKMYDYGILGKRMGPIAYINLSKLQRSEFLNTAEKIGDFTYAAAYAPIRNAQNQTVAYIGLPYYENEADYNEKIGLFINTLINIYALVFVLIGVLAVFLANQITSPLTFIQENIKRTKLGQKNQPIVWHRQDEIGLLVKEYNKMIAALELSAVKLARSERESAWREMAKQVAHEIKNPLTPLKLGVQLLEKSWKENDPNFEKKFASFNKSFIEQIDSLATIASEFSNFAKMPDTKLEHLELLPIIEQAIAVFNSSENVEINILNRSNRKAMVLGDKDQLLRTFNNLLKNAIEASEGKAKCVVRIKIINDEKRVYVEVEDNGKGISDILKDKIFVPNFTTKSSGTGLGLAFVKQAIENAGGEIEFNSVENQGTTFYLNFPIVD